MPAPATIENRAASALACFPSKRRYLVGVSGGRDSMALLHLLAGLGYRKLIVCHLDHGLRGRASATDARFVEKLATRLGFRAELEKADVAMLAKTRKQSVETAAREARYDFFMRVARAERCRSIFLAHHADDQVETFLFNLFRGAGTTGLGAMRAVSKRGNLEVIRPLLGVWREEIDAFVKARCIKFREDASNRDTVHVRNRMRHDIIPAIEKAFGRNIRQSVWRTAEILAAENEWLAALTPAPATELSVPELQALPDAAQRRVIRAWLAGAGVSDFGFDDIEATRSLLNDHKRAKINLPGARHVRRRAKKLFIE